MHTSLTFEELEHQVEQLPPHQQLQLVARLSEKLSTFTLNPASGNKKNKKRIEKDQLVKLNAWLAECDKVAELWEGEFDSAEDLRRIRDEG